MEKTIVILDTKGLASIESCNKLFDNQMATMAVFSSDLISILGITFIRKVY
jgi:hypothetical protein